MEQVDNFPDENSNATEIVNWASLRYERKAIFACSFSAEDMVILHMIVSCRDAGIRIPEVITLDTGRLHEETYEVMQSAMGKYDIEIKALHPDGTALSEMVTAHGPNLFYKSIELRQKCCNIRKTVPLNLALENKLAWITGLRREQSPGRSQVKKISRDDARNGLIKINPIADWSGEEVWGYIHRSRSVRGILRIRFPGQRTCLDGKRKRCRRCDDRAGRPDGPAAPKHRVEREVLRS